MEYLKYTQGRLKGIWGNNPKKKKDEIVKNGYRKKVYRDSKFLLFKF